MKTTLTGKICLAILFSFMAFIFSLPAKAGNIFDYSGGIVSVNHITGEQPLSFGELELFAGKGNVHLYGFIDINDNGTSFYKMDAKLFKNNSNLFVQYVQKSFRNKVGTAETNHYMAAGRKVEIGKGFFNAALAVRVTDNGFRNKTYYNGLGILINGSQPFIFGTAIDGWIDYNVGQDRFYAPSIYELRGNVGIRKNFKGDVHVRVASHFVKSRVVASNEIHFQLGYNF